MNAKFINEVTKKGFLDPYYVHGDSISPLKELEITSYGGKMSHFGFLIFFIISIMS